VAYSRVHTGVHYPGDVVVGALIGEGTGQAVAGLMDRLMPASKPTQSGHDEQREPSGAAPAEGTPASAPAPEPG
jgi:membrane-associated phospholipid phosphatase